jgi:hypothetical protein
VLVYYSGWGYWEYDSYDGDGLETTYDASPLTKVASIFELPEEAEKDMYYQGEYTTSYLLASSETDIEMPKMNNPNMDSQPRFIICEEEKKGEQTHSPDTRQVIKTKKTFFKLGILSGDTLFNKNTNQTEIASELESITDQKMIVATNATNPNSKKRGRRPKQYRLLLSIIDELEYERLNIPTGGKQIILKKCLIQNNIFSSPSVFDSVWSELSVSGQISITDKEKYQ